MLKLDKCLVSIIIKLTDKNEHIIQDIITDLKYIIASIVGINA